MIRFNGILGTELSSLLSRVILEKNLSLYAALSPPGV